MANINRFESDSVYSRHTDRTKIISIASGKGGVGKSTITANLALQLSHLGNQVLILDGDFGMSNIDILFNHRSKHTIMDFFDSELRVEEIAREIHPNIQLISGGSGIYELRNLDNFQKRALMDEVTNYSKRFDFLLIDTSPGIDDNVLYLNAAADEILVIINPDPASITDSYALIKVLNQRFKTNNFSILCNNVQNETEALQLFYRVSNVAQDHLYVSLDYKGFIPMDHNLQKATKQQQLISLSNPRSQSSLALQGLAKNMSGFNHVKETHSGIQYFWSQVVGVA